MKIYFHLSFYSIFNLDFSFSNFVILVSKLWMQTQILMTFSLFQIRLVHNLDYFCICNINKTFFFFILGRIGSLRLTRNCNYIISCAFCLEKTGLVLKEGFVSFIKEISIDIGIIGIVFPVNGEVIGILILLL